MIWVSRNGANTDCLGCPPITVALLKADIVAQPARHLLSFLKNICGVDMLKVWTSNCLIWKMMTESVGAESPL